MSWVNNYVGLPYADDGFDRSGVDCRGLVRLVLGEQCAVWLPKFEEISAADVFACARGFQRAKSGGPWIEIDRKQVRAFDCVLMAAMTDDTQHRYPGHCGVMVDAVRVLHVWRATHAVTMRLDHMRLHNKVLGFYRHKDLASTGIGI